MAGSLVWLKYFWTNHSQGGKNRAGLAVIGQFSLGYPTWRILVMMSLLLHAVRDSAPPNPKMHQERNTIEIEMYCGSKYSKTGGTWSLTLVAPA